MFQRAWQRIEKTITLHGATPHIFRHTFLTLSASSGIDFKTLQALAGHSDIQITMNRYVHTQKDNIIKARETFVNQVFLAEKMQHNDKPQTIAG